MEREKLIQDIVLEAHKQGIVTNAELATFRDGVTVGVEAGYSAASAWVPVAERNPESGEYFVTCIGGYMAEAYFTDRWYSSVDDMEMTAARFNEVTAWMPKPAPFGGTNES